ncbi:unnamed protein product [Cuscuta europaea]|uniref:Trichome birefringence-like N-terminal domain-containing protein n=1 Tax=Cuscuta europaea TaxID=41803 RepID=A0A9P0YS94_CUSEU|nr:unnamed protein product [Cuscuta europaea]
MALLYPNNVFSYSFTALFLLSLYLRSTAYYVWKGRHSQQQHIQQARMPVIKPSCNMFYGSWIYDESYPLYSPSSCNFIDSTFDCSRRPDTNYLKYRWQPAACDLPSFNGIQFLNKMRGKSVMFVGDSLSRNQFESLICMIQTLISPSDPKPQTQMNGGDPLSSVSFPEYGVKISYYKAVFLVDIDMYQGKRYLKLDDIRGNGNAWLNADVLSFNTGHWWSHSGSTQGWDYVEYDGVQHQAFQDPLDALERGLRTWSQWVDDNVDFSRTKVFFQNISPTHYGSGQWNIGPTSTTLESCTGQTGPSMTYPVTYPDPIEEVLANVIGGMKNQPFLLNITALSEMRKDAHPSVYSASSSSAEMANQKTADCSHWCLPGLPDTWNVLFNYALSL